MTDPGLPEVSFHDSEVLALRVERQGPTLELDVETFAQTDRAIRYRIEFLEVSELEADGGNEQNVLFDLTGVSTDSGWQVVLVPSYGLGGRFVCREIRSEIIR